MIKINHLSKKFGNLEVLKDIKAQSQILWDFRFLS